MFPQSVAQMDASSPPDDEDDLQMRKIKSNFFISLDGVVESPDQWHFPYFDDDMGAAVGAGFATTDAILMGRVLYDEWARTGPSTPTSRSATCINPIKKYVVSDSLQSAEWENTEVISGDVAQTLRELKAQDGGDITMSGSAHHRPLAAARGPAGRAQPAGAPARRRRRQGPPASAGLSPRSPELLGSEAFGSGVLNCKHGPVHG